MFSEGDTPVMATHTCVACNNCRKKSATSISNEGVPKMGKDKKKAPCRRQMWSTFSQRSRLGINDAAFATNRHSYRSASAALLIVCILNLTSGVSSLATSYYPPTSNAALQQPVTVTPSEGTCGFDGSASYCRSFSDPSSVSSCWEGRCDLSCPWGDSLPYSIETFAYVQSGWGDCVALNDTVDSPETAGSGRLVHFRGHGTDVCYLTLVPEWLVPLSIQGSWSITITAWVRAMVAGRPSTIISMGSDILRVFVDASSRVALDTGSEVFTSSNWTISLDTWTFVAIQVQPDSLAVHLDGVLAGEAKYGITFPSPGLATQFRVGQSFLDGDPFVGFLMDLDIYTEVLTNREIWEVYAGSLPTTRIQSQCRCPPSHPMLKPSADTYCVANPGSGRPQTEEYRLSRDAHPPEFLNDGLGDTNWISAVGEMDIMIEITLKNTLEVSDVILQFYSPLPGSILLERKASAEAEFEMWQYYAHDCLGTFNLEQDGALANALDVNCISMMPENGAVEYTGAEVRFDPLAGRPGIVDGTYSAELRSFLQAHSIRITMNSHPFISNPLHHYHALKDVKVMARCDCSGHGSDCDTTVDPYVCECAPNSYTEGRVCDTCIAGAFQDSSVDVTSPNRCQLCDCHTEGTVDGDIACHDLDGQCNCKSQVTGRRCDTCVSGYFNLAEENPEGCQICQCTAAGTDGDPQLCDSITGQCSCKSHVTGLSCDQCEEGFYMLDAGNQDGCTDCQCNTDGTVGGAMDCDASTGQCDCKEYVTGLQCDECAEGTYGLSSSDPDGCIPCGCDPMGSHNSSCNPLTGNCYCKAQVIGDACDQCVAGFYAVDQNDFQVNGCTHICNCNPEGSDPGAADSCEKIGGQCSCKELVTGTHCDECVLHTYGFNQSPETGCVPCDCEVAGTQDHTEQCDVESGQCQCKLNVEGRRCDTCVNNTYGLDMADPNGCQPCDCYIWGTQQGILCDAITGRCNCIEGAGDPAVTNYTCSPYVITLSPSFGPESGGTVVTVQGGFLSGAAMMGNISIASYNCEVDLEQRRRGRRGIKRHDADFDWIDCSLYNLHMITEEALKRKGLQPDHSQTELICVTGSASHEVINQQLPVYMIAVGDVAMDIPDAYIYVQDPVITDVYPLSTIQGGGIMMTVMGERFDSILNAYLDIFMVLNGVTTVFSSNCIIISAAEFDCPTPAIMIPEEYQRRKRDTGFSQFEAGVPMAAKRVKRDDEEGGTDTLSTGADLVFFFGFRLDGVEEYVNMSGVLPNVGSLVIYKDPVFEYFPGEHRLKYHRPYWPFGDEEVLIEGDRLDLATSEEDYTITVGMGQCTLTELYTNRIHCLPPSDEPEADETGSFQGAPSVTVHVGNLRSVLGYLQYESTFWETPAFRWGVLGGVAGVIVAIILLVILICCCRRRRKVTDHKHPILELETHKHNNPYISAYSAESLDSNGTYMNPESDLMLLLPEELRFKLTDCLVEPKRMDIGKSIGEGHYGRVYAGSLYDEMRTTKMTIAIKTLRDFHVTPRDVAEFLEEATIMKDFKHVHVLHLMGVVIDDLNRAYVLLPYMENGDMKAYISSDGNLLTVGELINFGLQIAAGMFYLSEQRFIHRDLAARNCMVDKRLVVKIADFGLSRDLYERDYYRDGETTRPLPVKWMSLESLEHGIYTTKSDVWAFGVLLWELMTRGCTPYPDVDSFDIKNYILCGNRMDKPDFAPIPVYQIMLECWDERPDNRPTFNDLIGRLSKFLESSTMMRQNNNRYVRPRSFHQHEQLPVDLLP